LIQLFYLHSPKSTIDSEKSFARHSFRHKQITIRKVTGNTGLLWWVYQTQVKCGYHVKPA